mgnify:CR=1 FL=1
MAIRSRFRLRCVGMLKFISWYSMVAPNFGFAMGLSKAWRVLRDVRGVRRLFDY